MSSVYYFPAFNQNWGFTSFCKNLVYKNSQKSIGGRFILPFEQMDRHDTANSLYQLCKHGYKGGGVCSVTLLWTHTHTHTLIVGSHQLLWSEKHATFAEINIFVDCKITQQPSENFSSAYCVKAISDEPLLPGKWNTIHTSCMYQHINVS